ncbi:conserved hypothetical protein [Pseudomonas sp. 9AZ]|uniref:hypothetical protein n=1 Tax=Pseudomonas sp. 9AZ TaxID=2653168 RepID=UPI0012F22947|nr:hypothetical protein [Pseudomonas sp. 9AZ]VXC99895.1 conserved hypothetical protein [Pseudomonas sp. 9AZ]
MSRTLLDVQLAHLLYPLLIEVAESQGILTYTQLIERAKLRYPDDRRVANLIPVRMGRILWVIYNFAQERDLPRLTLVIVSKKYLVPGSAMEHHDIEAEQKRCYAYDWSTVDRNFDLYIADSEKAVTPIKYVKQALATQLMADHYKAHRAMYPQAIRKLRDAIIENIMNGMTVEDAFAVEAELLPLQQTVPV